MAISQIDALKGIQLQTVAGTCSLDVQDGRTVYVRAGLDEPGVITEARGPLDIGRGIQLSLRAHFRLSENGDWYAPNGYVICHRVDSKRHLEPTRQQEHRAAAAIIDALGKLPGLAQLLQVARLDASRQEEDQRRVLAEHLRAFARLLDNEADALAAGATVSRRIHTHKNGFQDRVTQIKLPDGTLLEPLPELPTIHGTSRYGTQHIVDNAEEN